MYDQPTPLYWTDPTTGVCYVFDQNTPHAEGEVVAFEPRGVMPEPDRARKQHAELPRVVAVPPWPLVIDAGPKNLVGPDQVSFTWEMPYPEATTALVRVATPGEIAGLNDASQTATTPPSEFGPSNTNPFAGFAPLAGLSLPASLKQQIEIIGRIEQGHGDFSASIPFNIPMGPIVRIPAVGSSIKVYARIVPRYTAIIATGGTTFTWLSTDDATRNALFNDPPLTTLADSIGVASIPTTPVQIQAFLAKGFTDPIPPQRIFFGWVPAGVTQNNQFLCPVARGAGTVLLMADASAANNDPVAGAGFAGCTLTFNQILLGGGAITRRSLNFPANTTVPLRADCVAIEVCNVTNGASVPQGVPFELQYDLGF